MSRVQQTQQRLPGRHIAYPRRYADFPLHLMFEKAGKSLMDTGRLMVVGLIVFAKNEALRQNLSPETDEYVTPGCVMKYRK